MVYMNLSVRSIEESIEFYCNKLGIFRHMGADRLVCTIDIDIIIDLCEIGTDRHKRVFSQDSHAISSFRMRPDDDHIYDEGYQINILGSLKANDVDYVETKNLGGHKLRFTDPTGNKFGLSAAKIGVFV